MLRHVLVLHYLLPNDIPSWIDHIFKIHLAFDGHFGCFHLLANMADTAINICVQALRLILKKGFCSFLSL